MSATNVPGAGAGPSVDPIIPATEPVEGATPTPEAGDEPELEVPEGGEPTPEGDQPALDGKEDGRVIPKWMKELQANNPEAYKKAKTDLFDLRDRRNIHPTVQAAREEHDLLQSVGGAQGLTTLREDATFFKDAANQFLKGDPAFVQDLFEEDPIAAALHVQPMLETYRSKDPDGYKSTVARLWDAEFKAVSFGPALKTLFDQIKAKQFDEALGTLQSFDAWYRSIGEVASKAEDPRVKSLLAERNKQRDTQEQTQKEEFLKTYRTDTINEVADMGSRIFDSFFRGIKVDAEDRKDLLRDAFALANRGVEADEAFKKQRDEHLAKGNAAAARQLTKARFEREMPEAVKRIARRYGLVSGKPGNAPGQKPPTPGAQPPMEKGWVAANARPSPEEIDRSRTTNEMIVVQKRAILKDGRKVDWSKLKTA